MNFKDGTIFFIVNPKSGASSNKQLVSGLLEYLKARNYKVRVELTQSLEHGGQLAKIAAADPQCSLVIAGGGDGTIRQVVGALSGSQKPLLVVPCGTENLLANELGFDTHIEGLIDAFENGCLRPLDLGLINGQTFTSIAGVGFDGKVVHRVQAVRTGHISHMTYFWPIWRTFWDYDFSPITVCADGKEIFSGRGIAFVGNISRYAIGLQLMKKADYSDGLLDVCVFRCGSCWHLLKHAIATIFKSHLRFSDAIYTQAKSITITSSDPAMPTELDGDPGIATPWTVQVVPQAIQVLVRQNAKPAGIRTRLKRLIG